MLSGHAIHRIEETTMLSVANVAVVGDVAAAAAPGAPAGAHAAAGPGLLSGGKQLLQAVASGVAAHLICDATSASVGLSGASASCRAHLRACAAAAAAAVSEALGEVTWHEWCDAAS